MKSSATRRFWQAFAGLPVPAQELARKNYRLWLADPRQPSLHFKKIKALWSVRIGRDHRALAIETSDGFCWVWIGSHADYEEMLRLQR